MKAVIFDMDGVLINTEPLHYRCWKEILKERNGIDLDYEIYLPCIGSTRTFFMELINTNYGPVFDDVDKMNGLMKAKKAEIIQREGFPEMPGIKEALATLKNEGYLLAVASSSPAYAIQEALESLDLEQYFAVVMSGDYVEHPKPAPDTFLVTAEKLGLSPEECLVVEDSTNGGKAAKAAGMQCVWFHNPDSGRQLIPDAVLEFPAWTRENVEKMSEVLKREKRIIRTATMADLDEITRVEAECFPQAEAATREEFEKRLSFYKDHFWLMFEGDKLIAFVDGMVTDQADLTDEMYEKAELHQENGSWQMIFGVNTLPDYRKHGYAGELIQRAIREAREQKRKGLVLTCKDCLIPYYAKFGFVNEGVSSSVHGNVVWNQMRLTFAEGMGEHGEE